MSLEDWGWDERWAAAFAAAPGRELLPARVILEQRGLFGVVTAEGERSARVLGGLRHKTADPADLPAIGDWIGVERVPGEKTMLVRRVIQRRTKLSRKAAGDAMEEQVIASNLDAVFVITALNQDFNARRLERFLTVCRESGAEPVILLNKLDACADPARYRAEAEAVAAGAPVVALSAATGAGMDALARWIRPGRTVGFVGSSGVGKSTLVNRLLGVQTMRTSATRASDERGRHTTTHRQMFALPGGGVLLDTPGMREMQFWDADRGLAQAFDEIDALASACRFGNCGHDSEPGCAVKAGVESGAVAPARLEAWRKLKRELEARASANKYPRKKGRS
ncbi:MAG TPA: ribosome small subunit-dependent GTPase A [Elusimicrobiota bacterium]|nr:ribosome small subunit-dependent GTPase A [Elusimicrobiota bacterium]